MSNETFWNITRGEAWMRSVVVYVVDRPGGGAGILGEYAPSRTIVLLDGSVYYHGKEFSGTPTKILSAMVN